jgi:6-phosphogluconolactonase
MEAEVDFYIGTYSRLLGDMSAGGEGIYSAAIDLQTGELTRLGCIAPCDNPSYLARRSGGKQLYATREVFAADGPALVRFGASGEELQSVSLLGELPCHVAVDATGRFLTSAQYGSGDIAVFSLRDDGVILEPATLIQHSGEGPNRNRQEGPHAHYAAVLPDRDLLVAVDLGIDAVLGYAIDPVAARVEAQPVFCLKTAPGSGPRHLVQLRGTNTAYLYCELSDEIYQLELTASGGEIIGVVEAFEHSADCEPAGAAIKLSPDQRHLYVSGRSQSKIAGFEVDPHSHELSALSAIDTGGRSPRDFSITPDGAFLVVANQLSDNVTSLRRDRETGLLEHTGYGTAVGSPVCVLF